jgi:hypothetical protein
MVTNEVLSRLDAALGHKRLNRAWAKAEILLGLLVAGLGLSLMHWVKPDIENWYFVLGGELLFVLGGYLALAGHRSHLYQSNNELTAYLVKEMNALKRPGA